MRVENPFESMYQCDEIAPSHSSVILARAFCACQNELELLATLRFLRTLVLHEHHDPGLAMRRAYLNMAGYLGGKHFVGWDLDNLSDYRLCQTLAERFLSRYHNEH